ncbi:kinase-like protein [Hysterangium stoloniferum]|nr:kinase-like protein [Hysterangium stoloniferum]
MTFAETEGVPPSTSGSVSRSLPASTAALVALSRNASVISSSSSNSSSSSLLQNIPRANRIRTFSSPRARSPAGASPAPGRAKAPPYLSRELAGNRFTQQNSKSRTSSVSGRLSVNDFEFGDVIGEGSYSTVMAAVYPPTKKTYAIKVIDKEPLIRKNLARIAGIEKAALATLSATNHPGIVRLYWAFHDQWRWYLVLDFLPGGDLQSRINRLGSICLPCSRIYTAQIADAVSWMHSKGIVHRDLKPENVLLGEDMRIKISDYGSAKIFDIATKDDRSNSWVGTPQYVPPELLNGNMMCKSSDFWAIGCILYQMISGKFPFYGSSNYLMWVKVKTLDYSFPNGFDESARDLVQKLLVLNPDERIGAGTPGSSNDIAALGKHSFFESILWGTLWIMSVPPLEAGLLKREPGAHHTGNIDVVANWDGWAGEGEDIEDYGSKNERVELENSFNHMEHNESTKSLPISAKSSEHRLPLDQQLMVVERDGTITPHRSIFPRGELSSPRAVPIELTPSTPGRRLSMSGIFESLTLTTRSRRFSSSAPNGTLPLSDPGRWLPFLRSSEMPVFSSCVFKAVRRTFPRQLLPVATRDKTKVKLRFLVLTKTRLLCLKDADGETIQTSEILIGGQGGGHGVVLGVERAEQGFVVQTASKSYAFATEDAALAMRWMKEIGDALPVKENPDGDRTSIVSDRTRSV